MYFCVGSRGGKTVKFPNVNFQIDKESIFVYTIANKWIEATKYPEKMVIEGETGMKKVAILLLSAMMILMISGCGGKQNDSQGGQETGESQYAEALDVLNAVVMAYGEDELFSMYGGNQENAVMDAPGKFDISKTEELENVYGFPSSLSSDIEDAATMVHMMNANTFTGAVYRLKEGTDLNAFADSLKSSILARQWICGQPDSLVIINVDGRYVITAFGIAENMENLKTNAQAALSGAQVIVDAPIA